VYALAEVGEKDVSAMDLSARKFLSSARRFSTYIFDRLEVHSHDIFDWPEWLVAFVSNQQVLCSAYAFQSRKHPQT
jgi:hypothetical protein